MWLYAQYGAGWLLFVLLFAIPDLSLLTGVVSRDAAAAVYNVAHSYVLGVGLAVVGFYISDHSVLALALAWTRRGNHSVPCQFSSRARRHWQILRGQATEEIVSSVLRFGDPPARLWQISEQLTDLTTERIDSVAS